MNEDKRIGCVGDEEKAEACYMDQNLRKLSDRWEDNRREEVEKREEDMTALKGMSVVGSCLALIGWVLFFFSGKGSTDVQSVGASILDPYAHQVFEIVPRQDVPCLSVSFSTLPPPSVDALAAPPSDSLPSLGLVSKPLHSLTRTAGTLPTPVPKQQVFQLDPPILGNGRVFLDDGVGNATAGEQTAAGRNQTTCQVTLMQYEFKDSFGKPFVGDYTPPACMEGSNTVMMNMTVHSFGTQFDRLAVMYFGDTEAFRTSTAEPKQSGISWTYLKDMSHMMAMWKTSQKVIFDLPNQTTDTLTGTYITTLTATFFTAKQAIDPADIIIPISAERGYDSQPSAFTLSSGPGSSTVPAGSIPRNVNKAIVTVAATGQGDEEFWWQNSLSSAVTTYNSSGGTLFGNSSFREVQLMIDGQMAGVVWPYPVIFTGGLVPAFWSPMVGTQAFDLAEGEIDVSPWLGMLCNGEAHTFDMRVVGLADDAGKTAVLSEGVGSNWIVSGKIFIWTDSDESSITSGPKPTIEGSSPEISVSQAVTQDSNGGNDTLVYSTSVHRTLTVTSNVKTAEYPNGRNMVWTQILSHNTNNSFSSQGNNQSNSLMTTGRDVFMRGFETPYRNTYQYPLSVNSTGTALADGASRFDTQIIRGRAVEVDGQGVAPTGLQPFAELANSADLVRTLKGKTMVESQAGNATLLLTRGSGGVASASGTFGTLKGEARMGGRSAQGVMGMERDTELWYRMVGVVNGTVQEDVERINRKGVLAGFNVVDDTPTNSSSSGDFNAAATVDGRIGRFLGRGRFLDQIMAR
ncbi:uncharacterized protein L3040_009411 [Drepanopeziza brunnea f. sp. 'multigermtubi']|nr:hypothetical protein L3040_009411 [Drepanopeziza brunnea f. sp. 'multigermtubi']